MIKSMTGYGKSTLEINSRKYQVEMKSLNHRYLDISIRMPKQLSYLEETIKQQISRKISRGKIDVFISWENNSIEGRTIKINTALAKAYIEELRKLAEEENLSDNIEVNDIARYPDVLIVQENQEDETIKNEIVEVVNKAVNNLVEMKQTEGIKIAEDLQKRLDKLENKPLKTVIDSVQGSSISYPYIQHQCTIEGVEYPKESKLKKKLRKLIRENKRIIDKKIINLEYELKKVEDSDIRQIIRYKYEDNLSWVQIMFKMKYNSESTARTKLDRFLGKY